MIIKMNIYFIQNNAKAGGGKDIEDMGGGLIAALNYKWNSNTKFIMIIADAR